MFFVSHGLFNGISNCKMQTGFQSDHSFVIFDIKLNNDKRGPGYWKFNTSFLKEKEFVLGANMVIEEGCLLNTLPPDLKWERVKGKFVEFSKKYGIDRAKAKKKNMLEIEIEMDHLKLLVEEMPECDSETLDKYESLKVKRQSYLEKETEGIMLRARERFYAEGE